MTPPEVVFGARIRTYCCSVCGKTLSSSVALTSHLKIHSGVKSFCCEHCGALYSTKQNLMSHLIRIHGVESSTIKKCNICGKPFFRKSALDSHYLIHSGEKPFSCHICNKNFRQKVTRNVHIATHTGNYKYSCSKCDKKFLAAYKCRLHMQKHKVHCWDNQSKVGAKNSNLQEKKQNELGSSVLSNIKTFSNNLLNSKGADTSILNQENIIDFFSSIPQCSEKSFNKYVLKKNISKTHNNERCLTLKEISCDFDNFNGHSSEKLKFCCEICGKCFLNTSGLKRHSATHIKHQIYSEKFSCKECNKKFKSSQGLEYHQKAHRGFYNFICEVCGKLFVRNSHFVSHMKLHSNTRPYHCRTCGKCYKSNKNLKEHMKFKHPSI